MTTTSKAAMTMLAVLAGSSTAQAAQSGDKPPPPNITIERADFQPLPTTGERIGGLKIVVTQVNYPGVPDRAACRFIVRAVNEGTETVAAHTLLRTYDGYKSELNTWMVPTGALAPGATAERLYSCKTAQYVVFDRQAMSGWPGRCTVNGEERSPCPLTLTVEANLHLSAKD